MDLNLESLSTSVKIVLTKKNIQSLKNWYGSFRKKFTPLKTYVETNRKQI